MTGVRSNAPDLARKWARRRARLDAALRRGLRDAAAAVDRAQLEHLGGLASDAPGSYAVPVRTGHLYGSHFFRVESSRLAIVGNTARYAAPIHEGRGSSAPHGRRPFLDDAVVDARPTERVIAAVRKALAV